MTSGSGSVVRCVVGLGNPGSDYEHTPHNLGYRIVDRIATTWRVRFRAGPGSFWWTKASSGFSTILVKPTTFMNRSGEAVLQIIDRRGLSLDNLLVVCDDVQLPFGTIRVRRRGGDGGHRGLESIIYHLGSEEFARLRIGIGGGENPEQWVEQVLSPFTKDVEAKVNNVVDVAAQAVECWIKDGVEMAMNRFNAKFIFDVESEIKKNGMASAEPDAST